MDWKWTSGCCKTEIVTKRGEVPITNQASPWCFLRYLTVVLTRIFQLFIMSDAAAFWVAILVFFTEKKKIQPKPNKPCKPILCSAMSQRSCQVIAWKVSDNWIYSLLEVWVLTWILFSISSWKKNYYLPDFTGWTG